jgi:hypothetical protein
MVDPPSPFDANDRLPHSHIAHLRGIQFGRIGVLASEPQALVSTRFLGARRAKPPSTIRRHSTMMIWNAKALRRTPPHAPQKAMFHVQALQRLDMEQLEIARLDQG